MMPGNYCHHASAGLKLDKEKLQVVWFQEADCAALLHEDKIMAVIPPWATPSVSDDSGYAKEFKGQPIIGMNTLDSILPLIEKRIKLAKAFWESWGQPGGWKRFQEVRMNILKERFGEPKYYYAIDGGRFPPRGLAVFEDENALIFITIGMSIFAQPRVELFSKEPKVLRRIEIAFGIEKANANKEKVEKIAKDISSISAMPWEDICWFGPNHSVSISLLENTPFHHALFVDSQLNAPQIKLPEYVEDQVKVLWMIPITDKELALAEEKTADELIKKLDEAKHAWIHKPRQSVI
jgi:hypothetical protein